MVNSKIKKDFICWTGTAIQNREALVFHELGHCLLGCNHRDDLLPNGADVSFMHSKSYGAY